jgi:hypothetical protein
MEIGTWFGGPSYIPCADVAAMKDVVMVRSERGAVNL